MTESRIRSMVGIFLILAQIGVVILALCIHSQSHLSFAELTTAIGLILPMFTVHTTAIAKYFAAQRNVVMDDSPAVNWTFALLAFLMPMLFTAYLCAVLVLRANGTAFVGPEEFKWAISLGETIFAVYLASFIGTLFGERPSH